MRWIRRQRGLISWALAGLAAAAVCAWAFPRAFPLRPAEWRLHRGEAVEIALDALREVGETAEDPWIAAGLQVSPAVEHRLASSAVPGPEAELRDSLPGRRIVRWRVLLYPPGATNPTSCCSTSRCPISTASRCAVGSRTIRP